MFCPCADGIGGNAVPFGGRKDSLFFVPQKDNDAVKIFLIIPLKQQRDFRKSRRPLRLFHHGI